MENCSQAANLTYTITIMGGEPFCPFNHVSEPDDQKPEIPVDTGLCVTCGKPVPESFVYCCKPCSLTGGKEHHNRCSEALKRGSPLADHKYPPKYSSDQKSDESHGPPPVKTSSETLRPADQKPEASFNPQVKEASEQLQGQTSEADADFTVRQNRDSIKEEVINQHLDRKAAAIQPVLQGIPPEVQNPQDIRAPVPLTHILQQVRASDRIEENAKPSVCQFLEQLQQQLGQQVWDARIKDQAEIVSDKDYTSVVLQLANTVPTTTADLPSHTRHDFSWAHGTTPRAASEIIRAGMILRSTMGAVGTSQTLGFFCKAMNLRYKTPAEFADLVGNICEIGKGGFGLVTTGWAFSETPHKSREAGSNDSDQDMCHAHGVVRRKKQWCIREDLAVLGAIWIVCPIPLVHVKPAIYGRALTQQR